MKLPDKAFWLDLADLAVVDLTKDPRVPSSFALTTTQKPKLDEAQVMSPAACVVNAIQAACD